MAPSGNRTTTNARAERAWRLHIAGRTWDETAEVVGYRSRQAAQKAVKAWLQKNPPSDLETARRANGDGIRMVRAMLLEALTQAKTKGHTTSVAELGRAVLDSFDKEAKLWGLHTVVPTQVDVNVTSVVAVLERAEAELLAALGPARVQNVIEGEVIP